MKLPPSSDEEPASVPSCSSVASIHSLSSTNSMALPVGKPSPPAGDLEALTNTSAASRVPPRRSGLMPLPPQFLHGEHAAAKGLETLLLDLLAPAPATAPAPPHVGQMPSSGLRRSVRMPRPWHAGHEIFILTVSCWCVVVPPPELEPPRRTPLPPLDREPPRPAPPPPPQAASMMYGWGISVIAIFGRSQSNFPVPPHSLHGIV